MQKRLYKLSQLIWLSMAFVCFAVNAAELRQNNSDDNWVVIDDILIVGNKLIEDWYILETISFNENDTLNVQGSEFDKSKKCLKQSNYFSHIEIAERQISANRIDVIIFVEEKLPFSIYPAAVSSQIDGLSIGGRVVYNHCPQFKDQIDLTAVFGRADYLCLTFYDPTFLYRDLSIKLELKRIDRYNPYEEFRQLEHKIVIGFNLRIWKNIAAETEIGYRYVESDLPGITLTSADFDRTPYAVLSGIIDSRDNRLNPSKGIYYQATIGKHGLTTPNYRQSRIALKKYFPIRFGRTILLNAEFGLKKGELPVYDRSYLGGSETVRGLELNSQRGAGILVGRLEYRFDIEPESRIINEMGLQFGGTVFFDIGAAFDQNIDLESRRFEKSVGLGARIVSDGNSAVSLDYGWALSGGSRWAVKVTTNTEFK